MLQHDSIRVFALGGVGEVGKNMYVVEVDDAIFVLDSGLKFPDEEMYGIDLVTPDITYLYENKERIQGIFLTHGHEDHIGGIPYTLRKIRVPIYGTALTLALVEEKLSEHGMRDCRHLLKEIGSDTTLKFGAVSVSFFRTTHSIPDSVGIAVHTVHGAIVFTGDFKFDQTPVDRYSSELGKMALLGEQGVLCLLSDSTNAERPGYSPSERIVGQKLSKVFHSAKGRIIVASFASNVHRLQQVFDAADENMRKVAVVGRSMVKVVDIAYQLGYLHFDEDMLISVNDVSKYPADEVVILTTGSQGEPMAALSRMAKGIHKQVQVERGDTVIIAATPIPGNELSVSKTIDLLLRQGAEVVYGKQDIHVSGHGMQEDLKMMINLMRPKYFIPVHGEYRMQLAHGNLAEGMDIPHTNIFVLNNGDVVQFKKGRASRSGRVHSGIVLIDGSGVGDVGNIVLRDRKLLAQDGILIVIVTISKSQRVIRSGPEIISRGFIYVRESEKLIVDSTTEVRSVVENHLGQQSFEWSVIKNGIRDNLSALLYERTKRRPIILPIIMEVE
ncbi:MAG: ribonuclease J [Bacilli bacterium]